MNAVEDTLARWILEVRAGESRLHIPVFRREMINFVSVESAQRFKSPNLPIQRQDPVLAIAENCRPARAC